MLGLLSDLGAWTMATIPEYAITDHGFIYVLQQKVIDPVLMVE
ncbi:hypothetical protein SDD30_14305 [Moorella naiadis]